MKPEDFGIKPSHIKEIQWQLAIKYLKKSEKVVIPEEKLDCYVKVCNIISGDVRTSFFEQDPNEVYIMVWLLIKAFPERMITTLK